MGNKKKLTALGIACTAGMLSLSGCDFNPFFNIQQNLYGPPKQEEPFDKEKNLRDKDSKNKDSGNIDLPDEDDFDPNQNIPSVIYGPPEMFEDDPIGFDPSLNEPVDLYGPPSYWNGSDEDDYE